MKYIIAIVIAVLSINSYAANDIARAKKDVFFNANGENHIRYDQNLGCTITAPVSSNGLDAFIIYTENYSIFAIPKQNGVDVGKVKEVRKLNGHIAGVRVSYDMNIYEKGIIFSMGKEASKEIAFGMNMGLVAMDDGNGYSITAATPKITDAQRDELATCIMNHQS